MDLPSNRIGILFLIVVLFVAGIISVSALKNKNFVSTEKVVELEASDRVTLRSNISGNTGDQDKDGLLDWQEDLRGTDKKNPDSDGDGTKDGDEIKEGRDPTVAGPNDTFAETTKIILEKPFYENYVEGTLTDNLSKNLFTNFVSLQNENALTFDNQNQLIDSLIQDIESETELSSRFKSSNLLIFPASDRAKVKEYGNKFAEIYVLYITRFAEADEEDATVYLAKIGNIYSDYAGAVSVLAVPDELASVHLNIINNLNLTSEAIVEFNKHETDPVRAIISIKKFKELADSQPRNFEIVRQYFIDNGIIFNDDEPGRIWNVQGNN